MAFTNNFRIERVYFERLKTLIEVLKSYKDNVAEEPARTIIENSIDVDGAVLLLYRNLGEAWAELADLIQKTQKLLQDLDDKTEAYHDELNERIDEVNNYLMALIRALEARVDAIEADLQQMGRLFTYDLNRENDEYSLSESGNPVTFESTAELFSHTRPHLVTVRGNVNGETTYFFPREYDSDTTEGLFEWYSFGFVGNEIHEITVTLLPDDSVNVAVETTDFTTILSRIGSLETRMTAAEGDIDDLEQNKQDKLTAGQNITIDANNVISASGGTPLVVTLTGSRVDKTYAEIKEAYDANRPVVLRNATTGVIYNLKNVNTQQANFTYTEVDSSGNRTVTNYAYVTNSNNVLTGNYIHAKDAINPAYKLYKDVSNSLYNFFTEIPITVEDLAFTLNLDPQRIMFDEAPVLISDYRLSPSSIYFLRNSLSYRQETLDSSKDYGSVGGKIGITQLTGGPTLTKNIILNFNLHFKWNLIAQLMNANSYCPDTSRSQLLFEDDITAKILFTTAGAISILNNTNGQAEFIQDIYSEKGVQSLLHLINNIYIPDEIIDTASLHTAYSVMFNFEDGLGNKLVPYDDADLTSSNMNAMIGKIAAGTYYTQMNIPLSTGE